MKNAGGNPMPCYIYIYTVKLLCINHFRDPFRCPKVFSLLTRKLHWCCYQWRHLPNPFYCSQLLHHCHMARQQHWKKSNTTKYFLFEKVHRLRQNTKPEMCQLLVHFSSVLCVSPPLPRYGMNKTSYFHIFLELVL